MENEVHLADVTEMLVALLEGLSEIPSEVLSALHSILQQHLLQALDLVDRKSVTKLQSPSGRTVHQVVGSRKQVYTCLISNHNNYCACAAYTFSVLKREAVMCKHVIACKIAEAMNLCVTQQVSDKELVAALYFEVDGNDAARL